MNKIAIKINELGPIRGQEIELKPVMLFTGESSLGKSYVNFLAYYLFYVFSSERMFDFLLEKTGVDVNEKREFAFDLKASELIEWMQNDVKKFFVYLYNYDGFKCDVRFEFENVENIYDINCIMEYSKISDNDVVSLQIDINGKRFRAYSPPLQRVDKFICRNIRRQLCFRFLGEDVYGSFLLPPGRASLLTGDYTALSGSSKLGLYDLFLRDNDMINIMALRNRLTNRSNELFNSQVHSLIKGDLVSDKEGLFLITEDQQRIPLSAAASSIKELTPLLQLVLSGSISSTAICIEEPEAHLHPEMQTSVADLLAACINENVSMQITTHSDYFLQRVNQLLKYGRVKEQDPARYQEICEETGHQPEHYLDKKQVGAYYFSSENGKTKIEPLSIGNNGIPMSTFFKVVGILSKEDEFLDDELEKLNQAHV